jgi:chaperonin GroES
MEAIMALNIRPLDDRVVIEPLEAEDKTPGGIVIPDTAKEKPIKGRIVAVGAGKVLENGKRLEPVVKKGDQVIFSKYGGTEYKVQGKEYLIMRESDILAKVE